MEQIGSGRTAEIYAWGENKILKLFSADYPSESIEYEFKASQYVYSLSFLIPKPKMVIKLEGRKGIIMDRARGLSMVYLLGKRPWKIFKYMAELAQIHCSLHKELGKAPLVDQKEQIKKKIKKVPLLDEGEKEFIIRHLESLTDGDRVCHGDFHPDNILIGEKPQVIDWMDAKRGNPAGDVARSLLLLGQGTVPSGLPPGLGFFLNRIRGIAKKAYLRRYLQESPVELQEIKQWILPVASARLAEDIPLEERRNLLRIVKREINFNEMRSG